MSNYNHRWRYMLDYFNKKNPFFAKLSGLSTDTIRGATGRKDSEFGRWARIVLWVFEELTGTIKELKEDNAIRDANGNVVGRIYVTKTKDNE